MCSFVGTDNGSTPRFDKTTCGGQLVSERDHTADGDRLSCDELEEKRRAALMVPDPQGRLTKFDTGTYEVASQDRERFLDGRDVRRDVRLCGEVLVCRREFVRDLLRRLWEVHRDFGHRIIVGVTYRTYNGKGGHRTFSVEGGYIDGWTTMLSDTESAPVECFIVKLNVGSLGRTDWACYTVPLADVMSVSLTVPKDTPVVPHRDPKPVGV